MTPSCILVWMETDNGSCRWIPNALRDCRCPRCSSSIAGESRVTLTLSRPMWCSLTGVALPPQSVCASAPVHQHSACMFDMFAVGSMPSGWNEKMVVRPTSYIWSKVTHVLACGCDLWVLTSSSSSSCLTRALMGLASYTSWWGGGPKDPPPYLQK